MLPQLKKHIDEETSHSWAKWVEPNTGISERTANNYIRLAEGWETIKARLNETGTDIAGLTMTGALSLLK